MRLLLVLALLATPATGRAGDAPVVTVAVPKAPPALPVLRMMATDALGDRARLELAVWQTPEQLIAMLLDGGPRLAVMPLGVAARLHTKGVPVRLTNISAWGVPDIVTTDPTVAGWRDLAGKTLFVPQRGSTPEALTRHRLAQAGLNPDRDVRLVHSSTVEMAPLLAAGKIDNAVLLEPQTTAALAGDPQLRLAFDFGPALPNAGLGGLAPFLDQNARLIRAFEAEYEKATAWVLAHPDEAGALAQRYLGLRGDVVADAIPRLGLRYRTATAAAEEVMELYRVLFAFSPESVGKRIPDASLFWR